MQPILRKFKQKTLREKNLSVEIGSKGTSQIRHDLSEFLCAKLLHKMVVIRKFSVDQMWGKKF